MLKVGSTLFIPGDDHLWIVIGIAEDSPAKALLVNVTDIENVEDYSCILELGDHHRVTKRSAVNYGEIGSSPLNTTLDQVQLWLDRELLREDDPLDEKILERVLEGARTTNYLRPHLKEMLPPEK